MGKKEVYTQKVLFVTKCMLAAYILTAGLLLLLAALLLFGGNKDQEALTADSEGASVQDEGLPEDGEEDPQADLEPEEEGDDGAFQRSGEQGVRGSRD